MSVQNKIKKLSVINDYLVSLIPDGYSSKKNLISWLNESPYSPYISLYAGEGSLTFNKNGSFISAVDNKMRYLLDDIFSFKFENFKSFGGLIYSANTKLSNILNCGEFFRAYPEFKDIDININISHSNNGFMSGVNHYTEGMIEVYADSNESAMRVLLHELQHSIQVKEGFAIGESYYKEEGVMDLFVGASIGVDGNYQYGSFSDVATKKSMIELDDSGAMIKKPFPENGKDWKTIHESRLSLGKFTTLSDILEHPYLFEKYPTLGDVSVGTQKGMGASFFIDGRYPRIEVGEDVLMLDIKQTLLHEIQHFIQIKEKWARGGNIQEFMPLNKSEISQEIQAIEMALLLKNPKNSIADIEILTGSKTPDRALFISKEWDEKELRNELERLMSYTAPMKSYRSLWGEQQARAVQNRVSMSLDERLGEDWTKTLESVEGRYDEPIVRYDIASIQQAIELEQRYLKKDGWIDYEAIERDGLEKIPKYFTSYEKFEKMFKNKISSRKAVINTPIGNVEIDLMGAFKHLTNNTNGANRTKYSGALISIFEDPLFVVRDEYEGELQNIFYKPMMSKNKSQGIVNLAGFALDKNGNLVNTTFFPIKEGKLVKYIQSKEEDLLYFKHAGAALKAVTPKVTNNGLGKTRASDEILSENSLNVNGFNKEQRDKNFKAWFGDSKVKNLGNERENCLQFGESAVKESNFLESVSFGIEANVRSTSVGKVFEPLVVYHGTNQDFNEFRVFPTSWFTNSASHAEKYSSKEGAWWKKNSPNIMSVYLSIKNPYRLPSEFKNTTEREMILDMIKVDTIKLLGDEKLQILKSLIKESSVEKTKSSIIWNVSHKLKEAAQILGFDGYMASEVDSHMNASPNFYSTFSPFNPTQIKSIHNQGTFNSEKPNILEKNDYGMRHIEKVLSIVPDNIKIDVVKNYLAFNGITQNNLQGSIYCHCLDNDLFFQPIKVVKNINKDSAYFTSAGEVEARKIEDLYVHENKIDEMSLEELIKRFDEKVHGKLKTLCGFQNEEQLMI